MILFPIVSDKKKELIGNFKNPGTRYKRTEDVVNDHDFITYATGKAFPSGLYDLNWQEGCVYVGQSLWDVETKSFTSSETPEFAAENVLRWWRDYGIKRYPNAGKITKNRGGTPLTSFETVLQVIYDLALIEKMRWVDEMKEQKRGWRCKLSRIGIIFHACIVIPIPVVVVSGLIF